MGWPFSLRNETSASPTPSSVIAALDIDVFVLAKRLRRRFHGLLISRRERAQSMLHAVAQLAQHHIGNIEGILRNEVNADALGTDQANHLLRFFPADASGASLNSKWASSKKKTSFGFSGSPTSGRRSNSSDNNQSKNVAYSLGALISLSALKILITPRPRHRSASCRRDRAPVRQKMIATLPFELQ